MQQNWLLTLIALLALGGCETIEPSSRVIVSSTTFYTPPLASPGSVIVEPIDERQSDSLEFKNYAQLLKDTLASRGFGTAESNEAPHYRAFMTYGISGSNTQFSTVPVYGLTGGGTTHFAGAVNGQNFSGNAWTMPTYGMVGVSNESTTSYRRELNIDIYDVSQDPPKKAFEIRGISIGTCSNINGVMPSIIKGTMANFPNDSGKTQSIEVPWPGTC